MVNVNLEVDEDGLTEVLSVHVEDVIMKLSKVDAVLGYVLGVSLDPSIVWPPCRLAGIPAVSVQLLV